MLVVDFTLKTFIFENSFSTIINIFIYNLETLLYKHTLKMGK